MRIRSRYLLQILGYGLIILISASCVPPEAEEEFPEDEE